MILVNGKQCDSVSVLDRGLAYGDGVFETLPVVHHHPVLLEAHLTRLHRGCTVLGIDPPNSNEIAEQVKQLVDTCSKRCVVKIIVTRGMGSGGYASHRIRSAATTIVMMQDFPTTDEEWNKSGIDVCLCKYPLSRNPYLAGIKHLNRLDQILARREWEDEFQEGLMLDADRRVIEGTMSNVFVQIDGQLVTPDLTQCGVEGIMRDYILKLCEQLSIPHHISTLTLTDLHNAQSLFFCNSVRGIWPVKQFDGKFFVISPIVRQLQLHVSELLS